MITAKLDNGKLPAFSFPGCYPLYYIAADHGIFCPSCANGENGSRAAEYLDPDCPDDKQWRIIACEANYVDESLYCSHCDKKIESAYGD